VRDLDEDTCVSEWFKRGFKRHGELHLEMIWSPVESLTSRQGQIPSTRNVTCLTMGMAQWCFPLVGTFWLKGRECQHS
jgi:hypothetical protein